MKESPRPAQQNSPGGLDGIVLVGLGVGAESGPGSLPPLAAVSRRLAETLRRPVLELDTTAGPDAALSGLGHQAEACGGGWLAGLESDVGLSLADGRCWAEALGAWRQPVVLVIASHQLYSGVPAAATALLRQWQVPLLGLLQWGGVWQAGERQREGLPWLGLLEPEDRSDAAPADDSGPALATAVALRWSQLERP
jgi:hypothetical protein